MTFLSLFSGIGGMDEGLECAGLKCIGQVEQDEYRRWILEKHWPDVPKWSDVREFKGEYLSERPDLIAGGFPCQDISLAGKRDGIDGQRSGLWSQFRRIICELRPKFVLVENVTALLVPEDDGGPAPISRVLGDLASLGLDAEWDCIPASAVGTYHERDRIFVLAYGAGVYGLSHDLLGSRGEWGPQLESRRLHSVAVAERAKRENARLEREPRLARLVHGVSRRTFENQRLEALGDVVVPQVAEFIGRRIIEVAA
jgi:DNA (cytosine-5)-methyltransferase 1